MSLTVSSSRRPARVVGLAMLVAGLLLAALTPAASAAATDQPDAGTDAAGAVIVEILPVDGYLDPPTERAIRRVLEQAVLDDAGLVVLQLSIPGVVSVDTADLADAIAASEVPVAVLVKPASPSRAMVGGALELLAAADVRAATPDALLGPLAPLNVGDDVDDAGDVIALGRLAERWPEAAAVFADAPSTTAVYADELPDGVLDLVVPELEPMLAELDGREVVGPDGTTTTLRIRSEEVSVRFHQLGLVGRLLHAATTPAFIYLLLVGALGMLLFEVFQPGFGVAGFAGLVTLAIAGFGLSVLPVSWWALALVVGGLLLYAVDTAIAGFGPLTLLATAAFAFGSLRFYDSDVIDVDVWLVGFTTLSALVFFVVVMTTVLRAQAGPEDLAVEQLVGRPGIVRSVLNPEGHVYIDGALWRARWTDEDRGRRLKVGKPVRVHGVDGPVLLVEAFDPEAFREAIAQDAADAAGESTGSATVDVEAGSDA